MQIRVAIAVVGLLIVSVPTWSADEKESARWSRQIVGEWRGVRGATRTDMSMRLEKDGTFKILEHRPEGLRRDNTKVPAQTVTVATGRFKVEGKQLIMTMMIEGRDVSESQTIKTLTDKVLILANEAGKTAEYRKK